MFNLAGSDAVFSQLTGIDFNVPTTIAGLQGLNTKPTVVSNLDVNHGFPDFLLIKVIATLTNPRYARSSLLPMVDNHMHAFDSNLTIATGDVAFTLLFEYVVLTPAVVLFLTFSIGTRTLDK